MNQVPRFVEVAFFHPVGADGSRQHLFYLSEVGGQILRVGDVLKGFAQQFLLFIAEQVAEGGIGLEPVSRRGDQRHADGRLVEGLEKTLLALS